MGDWQLSDTGLAHVSPPFLLPTSKYTHRARTGNLWRFHRLKNSSWVVCHIKPRLQHNQGLKTAPWLIICWYCLFSLKQHTYCISHKALWRLVYSPLQMDCSPLCHKVNFIVFVHFPNLQITSSCTLITYYWKNRPSIFPLCFQFEYSLYYLDDLNLFFFPHWPFKEAENAPATLSVLARKNTLSFCSESIWIPSPFSSFFFLFSFFSSPPPSTANSVGRNRTLAGRIWHPCRNPSFPIGKEGSLIYWKANKNMPGTDYWTCCNKQVIFCLKIHPFCKKYVGAHALVLLWMAKPQHWE